MLIYRQGIAVSLVIVMEILAPPRLTRATKDLLPGLIAILMVLTALSVPVLLILWRLHRAYQ